VGLLEHGERRKTLHGGVSSSARERWGLLVRERSGEGRRALLGREERSGPGCGGGGEQEKGERGAGPGRPGGKLGWQGIFSFVFFYFSFLFSKASLNRILGATKFQPKGISTKIKYTSA